MLRVKNDDLIDMVHGILEKPENTWTEKERTIIENIRSHPTVRELSFRSKRTDKVKVGKIVGWCKMTDYDDCVIGVVERAGQEPILCYDRELVIQKNRGEGMSWEEAEEWYGFNQLGSYVGPETPCFLIRRKRTDDLDRENF